MTESHAAPLRSSCPHSTWHRRLPTRNPDAPVIGTAPLPNLAGGYYGDGSFIVPGLVPSDALGPYRLNLSANALGELDPSDNTITLGEYEITRDVAAVGVIDWQSTLLHGSGAPAVTVGEEFIVSCEYQNVGTVATGPVTIAAYVGDPAGGVYIGMHTLPSLDQGQSRSTGPLTFVLPELSPSLVAVGTEAYLHLELGGGCRRDVQC